MYQPTISPPSERSGDDPRLRGLDGGRRAG
jgi:hypothetical protein